MLIGSKSERFIFSFKGSSYTLTSYTITSYALTSFDHQFIIGFNIYCTNKKFKQNYYINLNKIVLNCFYQRKVISLFRSN
jgi:hypothetical protein